MRCVLLTFGVLAWGLQVEEQVRIDDSVENPLRPRPEFTQALEQGRETLILGSHSARYSKLITALQGRNHTVSYGDNNTSIMDNGKYKYTSVIVLGADGIRSKGHKGVTARQLLDFYDIRWTWPLAYHVSYAKDIGELVLPPSLTIFADPCGPVSESACGQAKECKAPNVVKQFLKHLGFLLDTGSQKGHGECDVTDADSRAKFSRLADFSAIVPNPNSSYIVPVSTANSGEAITAAFIQGEMSLSRASVVPSDLLCSDEHFEANKEACMFIIEWTNHRREMQVWANLQHYAVKSGHEYDEYTGLPRPRVDEPLELETQSVYTIRDELIVAVDIYELEEDEEGAGAGEGEGEGAGSQGRFVWKPASLENRFFVEYRMMVPYVRQVLDVAGVSHRTKTMKTIEDDYLLIGSVTDKLTRWTHLKAPIQHGIFKFVIKPVEQGIRSPIWIETLAPLRTYLHDREQPAHLRSAYPYYAGLMILTCGFALVSTLAFLNSDDKAAKED